MKKYISLAFALSATLLAGFGGGFTSSTVSGSGGFGSGFFIPVSSFANAHSGSFDGTASFLDMGSNVAAININGCASPFGIGAWIYQTDATGFQEVYTHRDIGGTFAGPELGISSGNMIVDLAKDSSNKIELTFPQTVAINTWNYVFWTSDGTGTIGGQNLTVCNTGVCTTVNGASASSSGAGTVAGANCTSSVAPFRIGARNTGTLKFIGQIDEIHYFSLAPNSTTIGNYYAYGAPLDMTPKSGIVSDWRFENSGITPPDTTSTIYDRVGNHNGTNTGVTFSTNVPTVYTLTAHFDGTSSKGSFGTVFSNWEYTQAFTFNVWVNPQYQPHGGVGPGEAQQTIVASATFAGGEGSLIITPGIRFALLDDPTAVTNNMAPYLQLFHDNTHRVEYFGTLVPMIGSWGMASVTYGGCGDYSCVHTYWNGAEQATNDPALGQPNTNTLAGLSIVAGSNPLLLGVVTYPDAGSIPYYFKGNETKLRIWTKALTSNQIASLYAAGLAGNVDVESASNVSSYPMQSPNNQNLNDVVGTNNITNTNVTFSYAP